MRRTQSLKFNNTDTLPFSYPYTADPVREVSAFKRVDYENNQPPGKMDQQNRYLSKDKFNQPNKQ